MTKSLTLPDTERDHVSGSVKGAIKLLEYGDYECPFCADAQPIVKEIQRRLGDDLLFAFRHFPLINIHPHSEHAAEAAEAASAQENFWGMHALLFENQSALEDQDLVAYAGELSLDETRLIREVTSSVYALRIREDFKSGVRGGVNGTPTFFINGERYDGPRDVGHFFGGPVQADRGEVIETEVRTLRTSLRRTARMAQFLWKGGLDVRSKRA
ncbi:MAG TPA: thioredoxin domain-containing protein [Chthoniobacterales bacterium]|nr:thioredoxin domain-containing protein [Chthoniobacterales bacterium]